MLGADGYLGWPTCMHLSARGHQVVAVDSLVRRQWDVECGTRSLVPIASMERRVGRWAEESGRAVRTVRLDLCNLGAVTELIEECRPDGIVHYAEQRSAPYSMMTPPTPSRPRPTT